MTTPILPDFETIERAARLLRDGALVCFPTETVYGLGADARSDLAVAAVFEAKGRPRFNPLIVHVPDVDAARTLTQWSGAAEHLSTLWPGPLTLVLPLADGHGLSPLVTAGLDTVGVRVPGAPVAQRLLRAAGVPVAAPSANPSGRLSPTQAAHVADGLGDKVAMIVDGGPARVGVESTIVSLLGAPRILRPGGTPRAALEAALGQKVPEGAEAAPGPLRAPGQLSSHYAPRAPVRLNASRAAPGEVLLGFGAVAGDISLSPEGNLVEAAARLFAVLHQLDEDGRPIAVAPLPDEGLGAAINDRLRRAAAPRD